jgi:TcpE family
VASEELQPIVCRNYTSARRHPNVIGVIGGWALPWPVTPTQLGVLIGTFLFLLKTKAIWGAFLPGFVSLTILGGVPLVATWAVRYFRVEGRSPVRAAAGGLSYLTRPRAGTLQGRPYRCPPPNQLDAGPVFVRDGVRARRDRREDVA